MAHANIYIRVENEEAWAAIADKSEWVNERLKEAPKPPKVQEEIRIAEPLPELPEPTYHPVEPMNNPVAAIKAVFPKAEELRFCKNKHPIYRGRDKCSGKGCKYA